MYKATGRGEANQALQEKSITAERQFWLLIQGAWVSRKQREIGDIISAIGRKALVCLRAERYSGNDRSGSISAFVQAERRRNDLIRAGSADYFQLSDKRIWAHAKTFV